MRGLDDRCVPGIECFLGGDSESAEFSGVHGLEYMTNLVVQYQPFGGC
jgi:hypothetical protein